MKKDKILFVLQLMKNQLVKKTLGQIIIRLTGKASPFFAPLVKIGAWAAVISAGLVLLRDQIFPALGQPLPPIVALSIEIVGWISATVASMSALTLDDEGMSDLKAYLNSDDQ